MSILASLIAQFKSPQRAREESVSVPEFDGLSDEQRCDYVFALAALDGPDAAQLLVHALDDPCEPVALAAARALALAGKRGDVESYVARHPGRRANAITATLDLLV